ncbi:hypothetical protein ACA910_001058 [Epithemia clementina (nom. ined.)]
MDDESEADTYDPNDDTEGDELLVYDEGDESIAKNDNIEEDIEPFDGTMDAPEAEIEEIPLPVEGDTMDNQMENQGVENQ